MSMLVSTRLPPSAVTSSMTMYDSTSDHSHQAYATQLPKYFNVPFAIQHGYFRCIRYLLQLSFDPNERDSQLRTPLILCAYVENDRWSLSLAQNLLEKGAKIALEDNARRNAMHHACALQRLHLVQLYLSCLDFNIETKDCEGNTCLHYAALTGNCGIAEIIMRSAEKLGIRLDQYTNREGYSAAVLALKLGHIECANQITHRDWDEFFVVPRPLSIYEIPSTTDNHEMNTGTETMQNNTTPTTIGLTTKKDKKFPVSQALPKKCEIRPSSLSFGLLKIIFNDSDTGYSTRLAGLCKQAKQSRHRQHIKHNKHEAPQTSSSAINKLDRTKSTLTNGTQYSSTEAVVNETQSSNTTREFAKHVDRYGTPNSSDRTSPRMQLLMQQHLLNRSHLNDTSSSFTQKTASKTQISIDEVNRMKLSSSKHDNDEIKSKISIPTIYRQLSISTLNHSEQHHNGSRATNKLHHSTTSNMHNQNSPKSHSHSTRIKSASVKKKPAVINALDSTSNIHKGNYSTIIAESSTYSQTIFDGRPLSSALHHSNSRCNESSCSIRETKTPKCRYNKPEELFGLRPEELFAPDLHQPKIFEQYPSTKADENTRFKRNQLQKQQHIWQHDVDKIIELYNIHHCANYRKSALPTTTGATQIVSQVDMDLSQNGRPRRMSVTKSSSNSKTSLNSKQPPVTSMTIPRRNSITRPSIKLTNA